MQMHNVHHGELQILLEVTRPASILLLDPNPDGLPAAALPPGCRVQRLEGDVLPQLQAAERFDLGVVANTLEHLEHKTAGMVLARLRDLQTRRFVVLVPVGDAWIGHKSHWQIGDMLGYGMSILARYQVDGKALNLFHYAIETYKTTPAWFNSQHWAHPERWKP